MRRISIGAQLTNSVINRFSSTKSAVSQFNLFNPTEEHVSLRQMLRNFVETEVDPQAREFNRDERFNVELFKKLGNLGLHGITVDPEYGGSGMDATAAVIAHGKTAFFCITITCFTLQHLDSVYNNRGIICRRSSVLLIISCPFYVIC